MRFSWRISADIKGLKKVVSPGLRVKSVMTTGSCSWLICSRRTRRRRRQCTRIEGNDYVNHLFWMNPQLAFVKPLEGGSNKAALNSTDTPLVYEAMPLVISVSPKEEDEASDNEDLLLMQQRLLTTDLPEADDLKEDDGLGYPKRDDLQRKEYRIGNTTRNK